MCGRRLPSTGPQRTPVFDLEGCDEFETLRAAVNDLVSRVEGGMEPEDVGIVEFTQYDVGECDNTLETNNYRELGTGELVWALMGTLI